MVYKIEIDPMERFIDSIDILPNGCWQWNKALIFGGQGGYGRFSICDFKFYKLAHQFSYWIFKGEMPKGYHIDHLCRNRGCVNPDHLEAVTPQVNMARGEGVGAKNSRKTHCVNGHEFTPDNTYHPPKRQHHRYCVKCSRLRNASYKKRKKLGWVTA